MQIATLCPAVGNADFSSLLHAHVQQPIPLPLLSLTKLLPPSSPVSSFLCSTTGKSREGLGNLNSLSEQQAGKCKSLLLR